MNTSILPRLIDDEFDAQMVAALDKTSIPQDTRDNLMEYIRHGVPCGSFLTAVLENSLYQAFARADDENRAALREIVAFLVNYAPFTVWGSPLSVRCWLDNGAQAREQVTQ